jgi:hypothetical protein
MMKIPMGNFGSAVAEPQQAARIPAGANQQIADAGQNVVRAIDQNINVLAYEQRKQEAEAKQADDELQRVRSVRTISQVKNDLYTLADDLDTGLQDGTIKKTEVAERFATQSQKMIGAQLENVDPRHRDLVSAQILDSQYAVQNRLRDAVTKRTQQEFAGELINTREQLQRQAGRDRLGANQLWEQTLDQMGPAAGMDPKAIAAGKQQFREQTAETAAYSLVHGARNDMKALDQVDKVLASDQFSDLDPQRRAVLTNTVTGYKTALEQKAIQAAQRAEIAAARRERQAASAFDAVTKLADAGKTVAPEFVAKVAQQVRGTPYEAALPAILQESAASTTFATQPLAVQRQTLDQLAAKGNTQGWTPAEQKRYERLSTAYNSARTEYADDPLRAAVERGALKELAPLNMASIPDAIKGIGARLEQAKQVQVVTGGNVSPLTKDEALVFGQTLASLPIKQRSTMLAELSTAVGPKGAAALAAQIDKTDRSLGLAMGFSRLKTTEGRYTSELILSGQQAIKDKTVKVDSTAEAGWKAEIAKNARGAYNNAELEASVIDAAYFIQAGLQAEGSGDIKRALRLAGGNIIERRGGKIPLPYGWDEDRLDKTLDAFPAPKILAQAKDGNVYVNGTPMPAAEFVAKLPKATLKHAGQGRYAVAAGAGVVTNNEGRPVIVDVLGGNDAR